MSLCLSVLLLTGCASTTGSIVSKDDPYEEVNRSIFEFNRDLDDHITGPVSTAYDFITPDFVQAGIGNFFNNLKDINVVLNDLMQGKLLQAGEDTGRFLLNTTVGLAGIFDVATEVGLEKHDEDFAQTLAVWGVPKGPYLVLPILGSSTTRGIPGYIFDTATNPATYIPVPIRALEMLNLRAQSEGALNVIEEGALDPYLFTRESFLQSRQHKITDGESELEDDLDIDALLDDESTDVNQENQLNLGNSGEFKQASDTLNSTESSLEKTSQSFDELSDRIDELEYKEFKNKRR
ncbi:MAG: VacJ family lipoprotein [Methylococcaceae bacterium]|nr:VacJ family lipoprotein [Methylococcaceae bacterium]